MLEEKEKNKEFLQAFTYVGKFSKENNELTIEPQALLERARGKQGYLLFCVDEEIKHIAECFSAKSDIYARINSDYRRGGGKTNHTYQSVNELINSLVDEHNITAYFVECSKKEDYKAKYRTIFQRDFEWCWKRGSSKQKKEDEACWEKFKQDYSEELVREKSENIRLREIISRERSHEEKINALHNSGNECLLNPIAKCTTFLRRHRIMVDNEKYFDNEKYLEVHHLIPLSVEKNRDFCEMKLGMKFPQNLDVAENMVCLCSNCHNQLHYGRMEDIAPLLKNLYQKKQEDLRKIGVQISEAQLKNLYKFLNA